MSQETQLTATIAFGENKVEFTGTPEVVMRSVIEYITKVVPNIEVARSITLSYGLSELISSFKDYIKLTPEGARIFAGEIKLSDKEKILLQLVGSRIESLTGRKKEELLSASEIQQATGLNPKTTSSRLSELVKNSHVERVDTGAGTAYKITTLGINWLNEQLSKKSKTGSQP